MYNREKKAKYYLENREKIIARSAEWRKNHPERSREICNRNRAEHPEHTRSLRNEWAKKNPEKVRAYAQKIRMKNPQKRNDYMRKRKWEASHPEQKLIRSTVFKMFRSSNTKKNSRSYRYVGCTPGFLRNHLESLFKPGMSWDNYGEWHVDHIVPLSWWDLKNHPEHLFLASHWTNLQPLWGYENIKKGARHTT